MNAAAKRGGLPFARMHGCGNDFVVIDDRAGLWHARREDLAREICDRRKGLGGDGLILIQPGRDGAEFRMTYVNRTGMDGEMCGNGARCTVLRAAQPFPPVADFPRQFLAPRMPEPGAVVDHHEVVAAAMHPGEAQAGHFAPPLASAGPPTWPMKRP